MRDIFLVGCYTCQRVSDYNNIQPEDFTTTAKGTPIIRLDQQKTFMDYIKLSSDEIADEIDAIVNGAKEELF